MKSSCGVYYVGNKANTSERLFLNNPTMDGAAKLTLAFVGTDRRSTDWSETMLLALRILMSRHAVQAVQKHGLRPNRIAPVRPHEGRRQLTLSRPSWG